MDMIRQFQSTRPRGARPEPAFGNPSRIPVSIHAPAWGATVLGIGKKRIFRCFNPRARVGRDRLWTSASTILMRFNPRARVGRDVED